jgi:hypothetical protein
MSRSFDGSSGGGLPLIEVGVRGPRGDSGVLVRAPAREALVWDLENEIASTRRSWQPERGGWWIAMSYFDTVLDIVLRTFPAVRVRYSDRDERILADETDETGSVRPRAS